MSARLHAATLDLLEEGGLDAVSFAAVAARAEVNRATLYRRWASPSFLVLEALAQQVGARIPIPDTGAFATDLAEALAGLARFLESAPGRAALQAMTRIERDAGVGALLRTLWTDRFAAIAVLFERAVARGELAPTTDREALFASAAGAVYFRHIVLGEPADPQWIERVIATLAL